jgi:16S rRNA processing protein RimM
LNLYNPDTTIFSPARDVILEKDGYRAAHVLDSSSVHGRQRLIKLKDVDTIEEAQRWVGFELCVAETALDPLKPGEYYQYQVIGLQVFDLNGTRLGVVVGTWSTPGGDLYVIRGTDKEHVIPAVKEIVEKVDFAARKMIINPPDGLLDL